MTTDQLRAAKTARRPRAVSETIPPLENGDRLTRVEFERRYEASPANVKAELVNGVVYMRSKTTQAHASLHGLVAPWLGHYAFATPGCEAQLGPTLRLDDLSEPEPDAVLRLVPEVGGISRIEDGYLARPVELVVEVAATTAAIDLHAKKDAYLSNGVVEYVVVLAHAKRVLWFGRDESGWVELAAFARGVLRSRVFPGLWLDGPSLLAGDGARVLAVLERGLASKAHAAFKRRLSRARRRKSLGSSRTRIVR